MIFTETKLKGAFIIELEIKEDDRGFFSRTFCEKEFQLHGLNPHLAQINKVSNLKKGTLRGMHFQRPPHQEDKIVNCTQGAIFDAIIDLRKNSATYRQFFGIELTANNNKMLYSPKDFAHGYVTLEDNTSITYLMSQCHAPEFAGGIRFDDPSFKIKWPSQVEIKVIHEKDRNWPDFRHNF